MKIGDIEVSNALINLEHDVSILKQYLSFLLRENSELKSPSLKEMEEFKQVSINKLSAKYPNMGIK